METGPEKFRTILRGYAEKLRASARHLEELAAQDYAFPTDEEIESAIKEREERDSDVSEETKQSCNEFNASCDEPWIVKASRKRK